MEALELRLLDYGILGILVVIMMGVISWGGKTFISEIKELNKQHREDKEKLVDELNKKTERFIDISQNSIKCIEGNNIKMDEVNLVLRENRDLFLKHVIVLEKLLDKINSK